MKSVCEQGNVHRKEKEVTLNESRLNQVAAIHTEADGVNSFDFVTLSLQAQLLREKNFFFFITYSFNTNYVLLCHQVHAAIVSRGWSLSKFIIVKSNKVSQRNVLSKSESERDSSLFSARLRFPALFCKATKAWLNLFTYLC